MNAIVTKLSKKFDQQGRGKRMVHPWDTIKIVNLVASTNIGQEIYLKQVTLALEGADYDPKEFPASLPHQEPEGGFITLWVGKNCRYGCKKHR